MKFCSTECRVHKSVSLSAPTIRNKKKELVSAYDKLHENIWKDVLLQTCV